MLPRPHGTPPSGGSALNFSEFYRVVFEHFEFRILAALSRRRSRSGFGFPAEEGLLN
jgi:hypothetical protein